MINLVELQNELHQQSIKNGWWDEKRPFNREICLFHSEITEALEGDRMNLMDKHLPHYKMVIVEVADFIIRVLDWFGSQDDIDVQQMITVEFPSWEVTDYLAEMHQYVSQAHFFMGCDGGLDKVEECLSTAIMIANSAAKKYEWDLLKVINEKAEYNKHRADHKRENRAAEFGKKY